MRIWPLPYTWCPRNGMLFLDILYEQTYSPSLWPLHHSLLQRVDVETTNIHVNIYIYIYTELVYVQNFI
jgi:hypothetical protein